MLIFLCESEIQDGWSDFSPSEIQDGWSDFSPSLYIVCYIVESGVKHHNPLPHIVCGLSEGELVLLWLVRLYIVDYLEYQ